MAQNFYHNFTYAYKQILYNYLKRILTLSFPPLCRVDSGLQHSFLGLPFTQGITDLNSSQQSIEGCVLSHLSPHHIPGSVERNHLESRQLEMFHIVRIQIIRRAKLSFSQPLEALLITLMLWHQLMLKVRIRNDTMK